MVVRNAVCWCVLLFASVVCGQGQVQVKGPDPGVVRLGSTSQIEVHIATDRAPRLGVPPKVAGLHIEVSGPSSFVYRSIVNGRVAVQRSFRYTLSLRPERAGKFEIPAFNVQVGQVEKSVGPFRFEAIKDPKGADFAFLDVSPIRARVYDNEPLRFRVEYGVDMGVKLARMRARDGSIPAVLLSAPWLDQIEGMEKMQTTPSKQQKTLILGLNGEPVTVTWRPQFQYRKKDYHYFLLERAFLPTKPGKFTLSAPILTFVEQVSNDRSGVFQEFISGERREYFVYGKSIEVEVLPLPEAGRPADFSGGVGRFEVSASLNDRRVKVGGSLKLTLQIKGPGNLEFLEVPKTLELPGFHCLGKLEKRDSERVQAVYDLTPTRVTANKVPSIPFSYFDTSDGVERYVTKKTEPLEIVVEELKGKAGLAALAEDAPGAVTPGVDDIFDMKPLDVGSVATPGWRPGRLFAMVLGLLPWLLIVAAALFLRRVRLRQADVLGQRSRQAARRFHESVAAGVSHHDALIQYLADRLGCEPAAIIEPQLTERLTAAGAEQPLAARVQQVVEAGVAARYGGADAAVAADQIARLLADLEPLTLRRRTGPVVALMLACLIGAGLSAQVPGANRGGATVEQATAAYRSADYATAIRMFAEIADRGDRRAFYNLGNALYRAGQHARALAAYERARLAMPRDGELLANIQLCRQKLDLRPPDAESFFAAWMQLRAAFTGTERLWLCVLVNALAAGVLLLAGRRWRWLGLILLLPALVLLVETWVAPGLPPKGIVVEDQVAVRAEPSQHIEPLATLRAGVEVRVLSPGDTWCRVEVEDRTGYVDARAVSVVE